MTRFGDSLVGNAGMQHLNGNVLCTIDTETTGLTAGVNDLIEIAIVPLGADLELMKGVLPFSCLLKPKRPQNIEPEAMKVNGIDLTELEIKGLDAWQAAHLFQGWFERLKLAPGKKIAPLAKNWPFDASFIRDWLGGVTFNESFHYHYRDVGPVALFFNDRADFHASTPPFPKTNLQYLATTLGVTTSRAHRALEDALATAQCYKKLLKHFCHNNAVQALSRCIGCGELFATLKLEEGLKCPNCLKTPAS